MEMKNKDMASVSLMMVSVHLLNHFYNLVSSFNVAFKYCSWKCKKNQNTFKLGM